MVEKLGKGGGLMFSQDVCVCVCGGGGVRGGYVVVERELCLLLVLCL